MFNLSVKNGHLELRFALFALMIKTFRQRGVMKELRGKIKRFIPVFTCYIKSKSSAQKHDSAFSLCLSVAAAAAAALLQMTLLTTSQV